MTPADADQSRVLFLKYRQRLAGKEGESLEYGSGVHRWRAGSELYRGYARTLLLGRDDNPGALMGEYDNMFDVPYSRCP